MNQSKNTKQGVRLSVDTLETLPLEIELAGFGINKAVFLNKVGLTTAHPDMVMKLGKLFDWGYKGDGSGLLAFAVLNTFMSPAEARYLYPTFQHHFLLQIKTVENKFSETRIPTSTNNFKLIIYLRGWYEQLLLNEVPPNGWTTEFSVLSELEIEELEPNSLLNGKLMNLKENKAEGGIIIEEISQEEFDDSRPEETE